LGDDAAQVLTSYRWPGNVRELLNVLRRAALVAEGNVLDGELLRRMIAASVFAHGQGGHVATPSPSSPVTPAASTATSLAEVERSHIERVLNEMGGNTTHAA